MFPFLLTVKNYNMIAINTIDIFSYNQLANKAKREISRLTLSKESMDEITAIDYALNAAFTIFHLLEWKEKIENPNSKVSARDLCEKSKNVSLKLLHDVVTHTKHARVSKPFSTGDYSPNIEDNITDITTEDGLVLAFENMQTLVTENSNIKVYFGEEPALLVLEEALSYFILS